MSSEIPSFTGTLKYPLEDLLILTVNLIEEDRPAEAVDGERDEASRPHPELDIQQCLAALNPVNSRREAQETLFRLNGKFIEAAIERQKDKPRDLPTLEQRTHRIALLDFLQFITKEEHKGLFQPVDQGPVANSSRSGILCYPLKTLLGLVRSIFRALRKHHRGLLSHAEEAGDEDEEYEQSYHLSDLSGVFYNLDPARWLAEHSDVKWNECTMQHLIDPRGGEKSLFRPLRPYSINADAIQYRRVTRGDDPSKDPLWRKEDALLDLFLFTTTEKHKDLFEPVENMPNIKYADVRTDGVWEICTQPEADDLDADEDMGSDASDASLLDDDEEMSSKLVLEDFAGFAHPASEVAPSTTGA